MSESGTSNCQDAPKSCFLYSWITDKWSPHQVNVDTSVTTNLPPLCFVKDGWPSSVPISKEMPSQASPAFCAEEELHLDLDVRQLVKRVIEKVNSGCDMYEDQSTNGLWCMGEVEARYMVKSYVEDVEVFDRVLEDVNNKMENAEDLYRDIVKEEVKLEEAKKLEGGQEVNKNETMNEGNEIDKSNDEEANINEWDKVVDLDEEKDRDEETDMDEEVGMDEETEEDEEDVGQEELMGNLKEMR